MIVSGVSPAIVDCIAGAAPLKGTAVRSRPNVNLNCSIESWDVVPEPPEAMEYFPGCDLITAISSFSVFAGNDGCTASTFGPRNPCDQRPPRVDTCPRSIDVRPDHVHLLERDQRLITEQSIPSNKVTQALSRTPAASRRFLDAASHALSETGLCRQSLLYLNFMVNSHKTAGCAASVIRLASALEDCRCTRG